MDIAVIGEVMLELVPTSDDSSRSAQMRHLLASFAGDTYNTAVYLSRLGSQVTYCTAIGDDSYSRTLVRKTREEGVDVELIQTVENRQIGLYMIRNLADGEREFRYWRSEAPARELLSESFIERNKNKLFEIPNLYLSGISFAILKDGGQQRLLEFLAAYRQQGGTVYFDSNFRPALWPSLSDARTATETLLQLSDVALLTLEDQRALWELDSDDATIKRCFEIDAGEIIIKRGSQPCLVKHENTVIGIETPKVSAVIDTTGAGDSFNAGYIQARLQNKSCEDAIAQANRCASFVIQNRGAIIPREKFIRQWKAI